jgi:hypothetical protein
MVRTNPQQCGIVPPTLVCGGQQQMPQAMAAQAFQPTPSAVHQCGGMPQNTIAFCTPQPVSQHICPTPSVLHHCGGFTQNICTPQPVSQHICPTPSAVQQCGQPFTQHICPTPSAVQQCGISQHVICATPTVTANIACLQTANTACLPITLGGCTPQSIACTPNGVFTPFGR